MAMASIDDTHVDVLYYTLSLSLSLSLSLFLLPRVLLLDVSLQDKEKILQLLYLIFFLQVQSNQRCVNFLIG